MKIYKIIILLIITLNFSSCFNDDSTGGDRGYDLINPIVIDLNDGKITELQTVDVLDTLEISPVAYKVGVKDAELDFLWTLSSSKYAPVVLGTEMTLKAQITAPVESSNYDLTYRVTDKTTGIFVEKNFRLFVNSEIGKGLLVADTRDEMTSNITLLSVREFNGSRATLEENVIIRNIYEGMYGEKIDGLVTAIGSHYTRAAGTTPAYRCLAIGTTKGILRVDPYLFTIFDRDEASFAVAPEVIKPEKFAYVLNTKEDYMINNGKIHRRTWWADSQKYYWNFTISDLSDVNITHIANTFYQLPLVFDSAGGRLMSLANASEKYITLARFDNNDGVFNPNELSDFECLELTTGYTTTANGASVYCILKHKETGKIYNYVTEISYNINSENHGKPVAIYDFSECPDIDKAIAFTSTHASGSKVLHYATSTDIYSIQLVDATRFNITHEYSVNSGEEITNMMCMKGDREISGLTRYIYPGYDEPFWTQSKDKLLALTIYKEAEKEGIIRTLTMSSTTTGAIEKSPLCENNYGGFGRITSIAFQY